MSSADVPVLDHRALDPRRPSVEMAVDLVLDGNHAVEWVDGDIDVTNAAHLLDLGALALADPRVDELVVDLSSVTFFDATGVTALVRLRQHAVAAGKTCAVRGVPNAVSRVLHITDMAQVFGVTASDGGRC